MASGSSRRADFSARRRRQGVRADFALVDQALLGLVHEFDRVFHGQDVAELRFHWVVDHGRQRGGLAEPVGPVTSTRPRGFKGQVAKIFGGVELFQCQDLAGNGPEHRTGAAVVVEGVDAKTRQAIDLKRKVDLQETLRSACAGCRS